MDVCDRAGVDAMVQNVFDTWGRVDILIANAGGGRGRPIDTKASTLASDLLHLVTEMNYYGTVYCVNAVAPIMKAQHSGKIVTVASVAALGPSVDGGYAHYGAAKAAILHYTRYLAQDLGPYGHPFQGLAGPGRDGAKIRKFHRFCHWQCASNVSSTQPASRHRCALSKKSCVQPKQTASIQVRVQSV
jgi:enoyl-[acyl-carrier-protein] reductase (NADH)